MPVPGAFSTRGMEGSASASGEAVDKIEALQQEIAALDDEREEALKKAETCRRRSRRLRDHAIELLSTVKALLNSSDDQDLLRQLLQDKQNTVAALSENQRKAEVNGVLAARLTTLVGEKEQELVELFASAPKGYRSRQQGEGSLETSTALRNLLRDATPDRNLLT